MTNKLALTIIVSIILTIIIVSITNVGTSLFLDEPEYEDYCGASMEKMRLSPGTTEEERIAFDQEQEKCSGEYRDAMKPYNQIRYYIFAGLGFVILLIGLFTKENMIQFTGLASGGILVTQGVVINLQNKLVVFLSLLAILGIFGILALRIVKSKKKEE